MKKKRRQRKESPFSSLLASFCTSLPLRSSSPALILSTPFLMVTVRGAHLFCSVVFCCCHSGDASFLCICTSRQGVGGWGAGVGWRGGGGAGKAQQGKARMPVVSADPDTPLGIRNQRTEGNASREIVGACNGVEGFGCWRRRRRWRRRGLFARARHMFVTLWMISKEKRGEDTERISCLKV